MAVKKVNVKPVDVGQPDIDHKMQSPTSDSPGKMNPNINDDSNQTINILVQLSLRKIIWALIWCTCFIILAFFLYDVMQQYVENNPISITTLEDSPKTPDPIIVTICNSQFWDPETILRYNGSEFPFDSYQFLYEAASGNVLFNDSAWVVTTALHDFFLVSSRILKKFTVDFDDFVLACLEVNENRDCKPAFSWYQDKQVSCYRGKIELANYGMHHGNLAFGFYFDPRLSWEKYSSAPGVSVTIAHEEQYLPPWDGVFVRPGDFVIVSASTTRVSQKMSFNKVKCLKDNDVPHTFNFTGSPFTAIYNPYSCSDICLMKEFYRRCNCSFFVGWNLTNTECLENAETRRCLVSEYNSMENPVASSTANCVSKCHKKCDVKTLNIQPYYSKTSYSPTKLTLMMSHIVKYSHRSDLARNLLEKMNGANEVKEVEEIGKNGRRKFRRID